MMTVRRVSPIRMGRSAGRAEGSAKAGFLGIHAGEVPVPVVADPDVFHPTRNVKGEQRLRRAAPCNPTASIRASCASR